MGWVFALFVVGVGLEALTQRPFLATRFGAFSSFCLGGKRLAEHLYKVPALPAFGFRAAAQTWGETVLVTPGLLEQPQCRATLAHEACHVAQYRRCTSFGFWLRYFGEWLWGLVRTRDLFRAYFEISLEREARAAQTQPFIRKPENL